MTIEEKCKLSKFLADQAFNNMIRDLRECSAKLDSMITDSEKILENVKVITA